MHVRAFDRLLYLGLHRLGCMGKSEGHLLRKLIRPGMRIIDVGANVGLYSLLLAELAGDEGLVLAFEPEPNLFATLVTNCALNSAHNITPIQRALGRSNGRARFQRSAFNSGDNRLGATSAAHESVEVEVARFDDFRPAAAVDFIKIDVQGHELDVLCGMQATIEANADVQILFEFCLGASRRAGNSPEEVLGFFLERNFLLYRTAGAQPKRVSEPASLVADMGENSYINLLASRTALSLK